MAEQFWQHDFSVKFPCKDCPDRHTACWSECEKYKKAKEEYAEKRNQIEEEKKKQKDYMAVRSIRAPWDNNKNKVSRKDIQY